jgi:hypothetical protein
MDSPQELREKAERYRHIISTISDPQALAALRELAARYEAMAAKLETATQPPCSDETSD